MGDTLEAPELPAATKVTEAQGGGAESTPQLGLRHICPPDVMVMGGRLPAAGGHAGRAGGHTGRAGDIFSICWGSCSMAP